MTDLVAKTVEPPARSESRSRRPLDRHSAIPLYHQLYIDLRRRLLAGEWLPGDAFAKDVDIEAEYGVSRITVRQAVSMLVDGNFVVRYRGKGSFVGHSPTGRVGRNYRTVREDIIASGRAHRSETLSLEVCEASDHSADQLQVTPGAPLSLLKRLHFADDQPVCAESVMLSANQYPEIFAQVIAGNETIDHAYARFRIQVAKSDQVVSAVIPSSATCALLKIKRSNPALFVERVGYSRDNKALDLRRLHFRADIFSLHQEIVWNSTNLPSEPLDGYREQRD